MKKIMPRILFALILVTFGSQLQAQDLIWANRTGASGYDASDHVALDASGNVYHLGDFSGTVDLDPGPGTQFATVNGYRDIFLQKLDPQGNLIWAFSLGGSGLDQGAAVEVDAAGNIIVVGGFTGTTDFDPGPNNYWLSSNGQSDIFILKLDPSGNFIWAHSMGASNRDHARTIDFDASNNIYVAGSFYETVDFDPGPGVQSVVSGGLSDGFVLKLDANGGFQWIRTFDGVDAMNCWSILVDPAGEIYLSGDFKGTVDFDPGSASYNLASSGSSDLFVMKLDGTGNLSWARKQGGPNGDYGGSILIGNGNELYHLGLFSGTVDFDPGPGSFNLVSAGGYDFFIQKLDPGGNLTWAKRIGGVGDDYIEDVELDAFGYLYLTGAFMDLVDFDPGAGTEMRTAAGDKDGYVLKLDPAGQYRWVNVLSSNDRDWGSSLVLDGTSSIYTSGLFSNTVDFDPDSTVYNLASSGNWDSFLQKLSNCPPVSAVTSVTNCGPYLSPSGNHIWNTSGVYLDTLLTTSDCDSILTIRLTVDEENLVAISDSSCGSYSYNGQVYTTSGMYQQTLPASNGCDTTVNLNLSIFTPPTAGFSAMQNGNNTGFADNSSLGVIWFWDFGDGNTSTLQNPVHAYQQNGVYQVCLTVTTLEGCSDQYCDQVAVTLVGEKEPNELQSLELYPNPSQGELYLMSTQTINGAVIQIFNAQGKTILQQETSILAYQKAQIDLEGLANGLYMMSIEAKGNRSCHWIRLQNER